jgi:Ca2+-binding RTX toxin-like protein
MDGGPAKPENDAHDQRMSGREEMNPSAALNDLSKLALVACDMAYKGDNAVVGEPLGEFIDGPDNGANPLSVGYALPTGWLVDFTQEDTETGFKVVVFRNGTEVMFAFAGVDNTNLVDWKEAMQLGWNQWTSDNGGRNAINAYLDGLKTRGISPTKFDFVGQSLGGALAEFAAFEFTNSNVFQGGPYSKNLISLVTFNGLSSRDALTSQDYGKYPVAQIDGFSLSTDSVAHYYVTNDLISRLGGGHVGGPAYELAFRQDRVDQTTGFRLSLNPVEAHRIESGFYRQFSRNVAGTTSFNPYFTQAVAKPVELIATQDAQKVVAGFVSLIGGKSNPLATELRLKASLILALKDASADSLQLIVSPLAEALRVSGEIDQDSATFLSTKGAALLKAVGNSNAREAGTQLLSAIVMEKMELSQVPTAQDINAVRNVLGGQYVSNDLGAAFYSGSGNALRVKRATAVLTGLSTVSTQNVADVALLQRIGVTPAQVAQVTLASEPSGNGLWGYLFNLVKSGQLGDLVDTLEFWLRTNTRSTKDILGAFDATDDTRLALQDVLNGMSDVAKDVARGIANDYADLDPSAKYAGINYDLQQTLTFMQLNAIRSTLNEEILTGLRLDPDVQQILSDVRAIIDAAGEKVVIRSGRSTNPFNDTSFDPDASPVSVGQLKEGSAKAFTLYLPYEAGESGQRIKLDFEGAAADKLSVFADGEEVNVDASGTFTLTVVEGQREVSFEIASLEDVDADQTLRLSAQLVDAAGEATHLEHEELALALDAVDEQNTTTVEINANLKPKVFQKRIMGVPNLTDLTGPNPSTTLDVRVDERWLHENFPRYNFSVPQNDSFFQPPVVVLDSQPVIGTNAQGDPIQIGVDFTYLLRDENAPLQTSYSFIADALGAVGSPALILNTTNSDHIIGSEGTDFIGGGSNDTRVGDDFIEARGGDDSVDGGPGDDVIAGGEGLDGITADSGNDRIYAKEQIDLQQAIVNGNTQIGTGGAEFLIADNEGSSGNGDDWAVGDTANDLIFGGGGSDVLIGGAGDDDISGDNYYNFIFTNIGPTTSDPNYPVRPFYAESFGGTYFVPGGGGLGYAVSDVPSDGGADVIYAGNGNDVVWGGAGDDIIFGEAGDDRLTGDDGNDTILGGAGNDYIWGDGGMFPGLFTFTQFGDTKGKYDKLVPGNDYLDGGTGDDVIYGSGGDDTLIGGAGTNRLEGGAGKDTYIFSSGSTNTVVDSGDSTFIFGEGFDKKNLVLRTGSLLLDFGAAGSVHLENFDASDPYAAQGETEFQFADGSALSFSELLARGIELAGTDRDDVLTGTASPENVHGGQGTDLLIGGGGDDTYVFNRGDGADTIADHGSSGESNTVSFGEGVALSDVHATVTAERQIRLDLREGDSIDIGPDFDLAVQKLRFEDGTGLSSEEFFNEQPIEQTGTDGDDVLTGTLFNDRLRGLNGDDTLQAGAGDDVLEGGPGFDVLSGSYGADTYIYNAGDGEDEIVDGLDPSTGAENTLVFGEGISADSIAAEWDGETVFLGVGEDGGISVGSLLDVAVHNLEFADGSSVRLEALLTEQGVVQAAGTEEADVMASFDHGEPLAGLGGDDQLYGSIAQDTLEGGTGNDLLAGGAGGDQLLGGEGDDELAGGDGNDTYVFNRGDGFDFIDDRSFHFDGETQVTETNTLLLGAGIAPSAVRAFVDQGRAIVDLGAGDRLDLGQPDSLGIQRVVLSNGLAGSFEDFAIGRPISRPLPSQAVEQGAQFNLVLPADSFFDPNGDALTYRATLAGGGALPAWLAFDAAMMTFSGTAGGDVGNSLAVRVTATDAGDLSAFTDFNITVTPSNLTLIGTPFDDTLEGGAGNDLIEGLEGFDSLFGDDGNDTLMGGPDDDDLEGGLGDDTYIYNAGDGLDIVFDVGGFDTLRFGAGILPSDVLVQESSFGLAVEVGGARNVVFIESWSSADNRVEQLAFADGTVWNAAQIESRISTAPGTPLDDLIFGDAGDNVLDGLAGDDDVEGGGGNDILSGGDGNDFVAGDAGSNLLLGGAGDDTMFADDASGRNLFIGGAGSDGIQTDAGGGSVVAFNAGDGEDGLADNLFDGSAGAPFVLSLGGVSASDIVLSTDGSLLWIGLSAADGVSSAAYAGDPARWPSGKLQIIGSDVRTYDLNAVVQAFFVARAQHPSITQWSAAQALDANLLSVSATVAYGGAIAYQYATTGNVDGLSTAQKQSILGDAGFVLAPQTISAPNQAPMIANALADQTTIEDSTFSFTVPADTFVDPDAEGTLAYSATLADGDPLPGWLSFDPATRTFSGTPPNGVGPVSLKVTATDDGGLSVSDSFDVAVANSNHAPTDLALSANAVAENAPNAAVGTLSVTDPDAGDTFTYSLQPGGDAVQFALSGNLLKVGAAGLDYEAGATRTVTVRTTDAGGAFVDRTFTVNVTNVNEAPVVANAIADQTSAEYLPFNLDVAGVFSDVDAGDTLGYAATLADGSALPAWLTFDPATQSFSGSPIASDLGTYRVTLIATDGGGLSAAETFGITITSTPDQILIGTDGNDTLVSRSGDDQLDGGLGTDTLIGGRGNDTYLVNKTRDVVVESPREGTDSVLSSATYTLSANVENLVLTGTAGIRGTGNELDNAITGNTAGNVLDGGAGADTLTGGVGNDTYIVDDVNDLVIENPGEGTDTVKTSVTYALPDDVENLTLTGTDAIFGTGNAAHNVLTGNLATSTLAGGAGNDTYIVDDARVTIVENAGEGTDLVKASVSWLLADNLENLTLTGTAVIDGTGNTLNNTLTGNSAANVLYGEDGNDTLNGSGGADSLLGGAGNDVYVVDNADDLVIENAGEGTDTVKASVSYALSDNVENLTLTGTDAINAIGNALNNVLTGNDAVNILSGGDGNDTLNGSGGGDTLIGGTGDDVYVVAETDVTIVENPGEGTDTVKSSLDYVLGDNLENLTLTGSANLNGFGNALDNVIAGNGGANLLQGLAGNDTLTGNLANDVLQGGAGSDTLRDNGGNNLLDGGSGNDSLVGNAGNEMFVGGSGNDTVNTGAGADVIAFNRGDGQDTVTASQGADNTLSLGGGIGYQDLIFKKSGSALILQAGVNTQTGISEQITFNSWYSTTADNRSVARLQMITEAMAGFDPGSTNPLLSAKVQSFDFQGLVNAFDAARAVNPKLATWALANALGQNYLGASGAGATGGDLAYYYGKAGGLAGFGLARAQAVLGAAEFGAQTQMLSPVLQGGAGNDALKGGGGNSVLAGGGGDDSLAGGDGNDFLAGDAGDDTIDTGAGSNIIAFNAGGGTDTVLSAAGASNTLSVGGGISYEDLSLAKDGNNLIVNAGADDHLVFKNWYGGKDNVVNLQVILDATAAFDATSSDPLRNEKVQSFDFRGLVSAFDEARAQSPGLSSWAVTNALLQFHLSGADDAALGGDLAYWYGKNGSLSGISLQTAQQTIGAPGFGSDAQTLRPFNGLEEGMVKLS